MFGGEAMLFFRELGRRTVVETGETHTYLFLLQCLVAVQRDNTAAVLGQLAPRTL